MITILIVASLKELITQIMEIVRRTVQVMEYTFKKAGSNKIFQNIKDFHRTTMLAITIATNTTDCINHSGHAQINNRSMKNSPGMQIPNNEYDESYQLITAATNTTSCSTVSASFTQGPNAEMETPKHKTLNNTLVNTNKVLSITWKLNVDHAPSHT